MPIHPQHLRDFWETRGCRGEFYSFGGRASPRGKKVVKQTGIEREQSENLNKIIEWGNQEGKFRYCCKVHEFVAKPESERHDVMDWKEKTEDAHMKKVIFGTESSLKTPKWGPRWGGGLVEPQDS